MVKNGLQRLLLSGLVLIAGATVSLAQECFGTPIKEGGGFEMASLNAKGKPQGVIKYKFVKVSQEGGDTVVDVEVEGLSEKGKPEYTTRYTMRCNGNESRIDASSLMMADQAKSLESFNMQFTSDDIIMPDKLTVGQSLKDASLHGKGEASGLQVVFEMDITDRKVEAKEKIKVGAGEFDAFKVTSTMTMKTKTIMNITVDFQSVSYRAPGVIWDVKTETYRKGKLMGITELVKIY